MEDDLFEYPIDGTLDLHMFRPNEVRSVLGEFIFQCRLKSVLRVRIIHGKGQGVLRQIVHSYLGKCKYVREYGTPSDASSWGATIVLLNPLNDENES